MLLPQENEILRILTGGSPLVQKVLASPEKYRLSIRYTKIDRTRSGKPVLTEYSYGINDSNYFYPASTVKLPAALLAAEQAQSLGIPLYITMFTDSAYPGQTAVTLDATSETGQPSLENYIRKIFLVSDNDAFNRLYEFIGRARFNTLLEKKGFTGTNIITRLSVPFTSEENKHTNPVSFSFGETKRIDYPGQYDALMRENTCAGLYQGKGYYKGDSLVMSPFSFHRKNRFTLEDMHRMLKVFIFPDNYPAGMRFKLNKENRNILLKSMATLPRECDYPAYRPYSEYYDGYVKYFMFGAGKDSIPSTIRIFNKVGQAYGYLIDNAYITDIDKGVEFFLSAIIYVNEDGIFNDDKYEYETVGYPFLAETGRLFYNYESARKRSYPAQLKNLFKLFEGRK